MDSFKLDTDSDGILTVMLDVPGRSLNVITKNVISDLVELISLIKTDERIKGVVLTSGKDNGFCAGADLGEQDAANDGMQPIGEDAIRAELAHITDLSLKLRALEICGKPIAAAINGLALGGGLEMLFATHYRVVADNSRIQLGLPESTIGLLPAAGGTQRLPRLIGLEKALPLLLDGKPVSPSQAKKLGLVDELVASGEELSAAKKWIRDGGKGIQPWDCKGFKIPGGGPYEASQTMPMAISTVRKNTFGNYPAQLNILKCVYEGVMVPIDAGLQIEARYFLLTQNTPQAKAMVRSLFLSMQELKKGAIRPKNIEKYDVKKAAVLGAGMMGAGVALVSAQAGIDVVLIDRSDEAAAKGKAWAEKQLSKSVEKGRTSREKADAVLARITPTTDYGLVEGSDIVVEAVFEDRTVKAEVTRLAEASLGTAAVFGSNTSGLPITGLAGASVRPENFIGIHFFSPVDRMVLVEIIRGEKTTDETLAKAVDFVMKIRKTPIVVNDSRGFYTSRTFQTYLLEGAEMLVEGIAPAIIDNIGRATGMPRGPLELMDDVGLDLCFSSRKQERTDLGGNFVSTAQDQLLALMVDEYGRLGRKNSSGIYNYPANGGAKCLWPQLTNIYPVTLAHPINNDIEEIKQRLLYRQALEAAKIVAEGVIEDPRVADIGALLGWGFPSWTGGPLSLIDQIGTKVFVERCDALSAKYGKRFDVPQQLREMARNGSGYYQ